MRCLAAVLSRSGRPPAEEEAARSAAACGYPGPLRVESRSYGPLAAALARFGPGEEGPADWVAETPGRVVLFNGWIDNRSDLARHLGLPGDEPDPVLLAALLDRDGPVGLHRLAGEFAAVVWEPGPGRLLLVRDPIGVFSLFHATDGDRVAAAESIGSLIAALDRPPAANRQFLRDVLTCHPARWVAETAWEGIRRVPPAHVLEATDPSARPRRYWVPGERGGPSARSEPDAAAEFRELLEQAVEARLAPARSAAILVSGGLDSSSVACAAGELCRSGRIPQPPLLLSSVFDRTEGADERRYLQVVAEACPDFPLVEVPSDDCWALREYGGDGGFPLWEPEPSGGRGLFMTQARAALARGTQVLVGGFGGDQLLLGDGYHRPALLLDQPLRHWTAELGSFVRAGAGTPAGVLLRAAAGALPDSMRTRMWMWKSGRGARLLALDPPAPVRLRTHSARRIYAAVVGGQTAQALALMAQMQLALGVRCRHPFLDRHLVDWVLGARPRWLLAGGEEKRLLRRTGLLPQQLRDRRDAARFTGLSLRGLFDRERHRVRELLQGNRTARLGLCPAELPARLLAEFESGVVDRRRLLALLGVEAWLIEHEGRAKALQESQPAAD